MSVYDGPVLSPSEYLVKAKEFFADHGGAVGNYKQITQSGLGDHPERYKVCMSGACMEAVFGDPIGSHNVTDANGEYVSFPDAVHDANNLIHRLLGECIDKARPGQATGITHVNDAERGNVPKLLPYFDCAIEKAQQLEQQP